MYFVQYFSHLVRPKNSTMKLLYSWSKVGGDAGRVDVGGEVGLARILVQCQGVRGAVVAKELGASTEREEEQSIVLGIEIM